MKISAKIISYLFMPPFNLMVAFLLLSNNLYGTGDRGKTYSDTVALLFGVLFPIAVFIYLRKKGKIVNDDATEKGERTLPYIIGIALSLAAFIISYILEFHPLIITLWAAYFVIQIFMVTINLVWKISAHEIGVAIPFAVLIFLYGTEYWFLAIIPLAIGWARLTLKVHTFAQLVAGFLLGFFPTYLLLYFVSK